MDAEHRAQSQPGVAVDTAGPAPAPALGHVVARGMTWMVAATVITKGASLVAQIVLGWKLSRGDFALFSTATAIAGVVTVCRGMGVRELLVQLGREGYEELSGSGYWLALAYNTGVAGLIAALAWPVSVRYFDSAELPRLLWVMALALPIGTPGGLLRVKLRVDLRFRSHTVVTTTAALVRQVSTIIFALAGFGAMSMALPVAVMAVVETTTAVLVTRDKPWTRPAQTWRWPGLMRRTVWPMVSSVAAILLDWGQFLVLGWAMGAKNPILGLYSFAYNITAQVGLLLAENGIQVMVPALVSMKGEHERQIRASLRALRLLMLVGSIACVGLATAFDPLEHLFWHGKWAAATPAVIVLGVCFCWRMTLALSTAVLMAQGRFKRYSLLTLAEGVAVSACALFAAAGVGPALSALGVRGEYQVDAVDIAAWTGGCIVVGRAVVTLYVFRSNGAATLEVARAMFAPWVVAMAAGAAAIYVDRTVDVGAALGPVLEGGMSKAGAGAAVDLARTALVSLVCGGVFVILARVTMAAPLRDALGAAPARVRGLMARVLLLG